MGEQRLLVLQKELYSIFTESKALKVALDPPPWNGLTLRKAVNLAKLLSENDQTVIPDGDRLCSWLDKYAFFESLPTR